jgi:predicted ATPase/class 3 adenylate cyclase/DNA-binding CsgD family transcriptional regulator
MLVSMSATEWSELGVSGLPTGTVTLLLADVEGSTRLWEIQPEEMSAAIARLDGTLTELVAAHDGVRPVEQGEGDSFVLAFARASDAVACALALQRAPLAPIRLRIGLNTGEIQLRDEGNYVGPTINRTGRLRDLAHGGQTVLSGATESMVIDHLPDDAWLNDLGSHSLRDLPRPERVVQLCHPDIRNDFPTLRTAETPGAQRLPAQLTRFVGRQAQMADVRGFLADSRLVTLTGAGGAGKTRLAIEVAREVDGDVRYVDLAPITAPGMVPTAVARALALPDHPGRSTMETIVRFLRGSPKLIVLDNCEHLLDASAALIVEMLDRCPVLTVLTTSREPIAVPGEVTWRVPSLSLADEAIELFADRARLIRPDFKPTDDNMALVTEICRRLDGMPLAIELAAARVRAMSLEEILDSLHDRFRLLTGGSRTAVRRQQTLRASVDWSYALLTEPERILFRRLAAVMGGAELGGIQEVGSDGDVQRHQVLDLLTLLVDKSLVIAEENSGRTRYRLLETVRQYALEKLGESGEADVVRARHRDHYTAMAAVLDAPATGGRDHLVEVEAEIDNLRAAFGWSLERSDTELALQLASSLEPLWLTRGRLREGLTWFDAALQNEAQDLTPAVLARALADRAMIDATIITTDSTPQAERALAIARELDDPGLLAKALTACGCVNGYNPAVAVPYFAEAIELARAQNDGWTLSLILGWQALGAFMAGDPIAVRAAAEEGLALSDSIGDRFNSRLCRWAIGVALFTQGDLRPAITQFSDLVVEAEEAHDALFLVSSLFVHSHLLGRSGDVCGATARANAALEAAAELGAWHEGLAYLALAHAAMAAGDVAAANEAVIACVQRVSDHRETFAVCMYATAQVALARGDLDVARRCADDAVSATSGSHLASALISRARVAIAQGDLDQANRDAHDALAVAEGVQAYEPVPGILESLACIAAASGSLREVARLFGAADAMRDRMGSVRFKIDDAACEAWMSKARDGLGESHFDSAWAEGAALSTAEAIAYARRGRGERKRPSNGWGSLTPTELDVVRLVSEGLGNKDIATRLFVSHRTVQTHLTHVYTKLGMASRVQLAQEAVQRRQDSR